MYIYVYIYIYEFMFLYHKYYIRYTDRNFIIRRTQFVFSMYL